MELAASRSETLKGTVVGIGACVLTAGLGSHMEALTGSAGPLLGLLLATAVAAWYAGRWAGIITTAAGAIAAAYLLPPAYSFRIAAPADSGALYSFALGGVIVSLLCGAAWQLRLEARAWQKSEHELSRLRSLNGELHQIIQQRDAALAASDRLLHEFARAALSAAGTQTLTEMAKNFQLISQRSTQAVDCATLVESAKTRYEHQAGRQYTIASAALPTVWGEERELRRLFEILVFQAVHNLSVRGLYLTASRLPESWLFTAAFRLGAPGAEPPLSPLEYCACDRIIARQGGRCWTNSTSHGDWELMFLLPRRHQAQAA